MAVSRCFGLRGESEREDVAAMRTPCALEPDEPVFGISLSHCSPVCLLALRVAAR